MEVKKYILKILNIFALLLPITNCGIEIISPNELRNKFRGIL
jgi:hypothetical protein